MAKQYYIKKDPSTFGPEIEWIAINGTEFYQLITSPAGKGRYFIDMDEFMIEATEAEYKDWRKAVTSVRKTARGRLFCHEPCQGDTPAQSQPQARRAAGRDPAGGGTPVRRPSQPPSKPFALTPGEVVSNAGAEMRLYRKVLISEAPGIAVQVFQPVRQTGLAMRGQQRTYRRRRSGGGPCFCGIKHFKETLI